MPPRLFQSSSLLANDSTYLQRTHDQFPSVRSSAHRHDGYRYSSTLCPSDPNALSRTQFSNVSNNGDSQHEGRHLRRPSHWLPKSCQLRCYGYFENRPYPPGYSQWSRRRMSRSRSLPCLASLRTCARALSVQILVDGSSQDPNSTKR